MIPAIVLVIVIGGIIGFLIAWRFLTEPDEITLKVLDHLISRYLDERAFSVDKITQELGLDENAIEKALRKLENAGIIAKVSKRGYVLKDPLVFLTDRDYEKALRLTKDDNILYGAYQAPYLISTLYIFGQLFILILTVGFAIAAYINLFGLKDLLLSYLPEELSLELFLVFLIAIAIILVDVVNNIAKIATRGRYNVIIGYYSGISYDVSPTDELSGRIPRSEISKVDINISFLQKLNNYFGSTPVGDIIVYRRGRKAPIVFKSMPYPREFYYVVRSIQLGSLQWRKENASTLALWRAGMLPFYRYRRRRKRR